MTHLKQAIAYVKDNVRELHVLDVFNQMYEQHSCLNAIDPQLGDEIYDLMEEYGEDNELPENWWLSEVEDEEEIFFAVVDLFGK